MLHLFLGGEKQKTNAIKRNENYQKHHNLPSIDRSHGKKHQNAYLRLDFNQRLD